MRFVTPLAAAVLTILSLPPSTVAAPPAPDGTISCAIFSDLNAAHPKGILFRPLIDATPPTRNMSANNAQRRRAQRKCATLCTCSA